MKTVPKTSPSPDKNPFEPILAEIEEAPALQKSKTLILDKKLPTIFFKEDDSMEESSIQCSFESSEES